MCPDLLTGLRIPLLAVGVVLAVSRLAVSVYRSPPRPLQGCMHWLHRQVSKLQNLQLLPRIKQLVSLYQVIVAIPKLYSLPPLPDWYHDAMTPFIWLDLDWSKFIVPGSCIAYTERLLLRGLTPLLLLALIPLGYGAREALRALCRSQPFSPKAVVFRALPSLLFGSFCLCPSVSAGIFSAWGCDPYTADSGAREVWSFLREDPSVICSKQSPTFSEETEEHLGIRRLALIFVFVWPIGLPTCYMLLLWYCRDNIKQKRQTPLVLATGMLHREYLPALFWWEVLPLLQRLTLTGFVLLIDARYELTRVMVGTLVALMYLIVLQTLRPYKHRSVNAIAFGAQLSLVSVFICATLLKVYYWVPADEAEDLMGFASGYHIVGAMLAWNLTTLVLTLALTSYQLSTEASLPTVRLADTGAVPELVLADGLTYHLFLSHVWSSGQDQVSIVKRQLQLLLPEIKVFLDVDDLTEMDALETHVQSSQTVLVFLSRGYFFSHNCKRELAATIQFQKPIILLHEADTHRGGAPLAQLMQECFDDPRTRQYRDHIFENREVILWLRVKEFQLISLKKIVLALLQDSGARPRRFSRGSSRSGLFRLMDNMFRKGRPRNISDVPPLPSSSAPPVLSKGESSASSVGARRSSTGSQDSRGSTGSKAGRRSSACSSISEGLDLYIPGEIARQKLGFRKRVW
jgi:hypothetical protein